MTEHESENKSGDEGETCLVPPNLNELGSNPSDEQRRDFAQRQARYYASGLRPSGWEKNETPMMAEARKKFEDEVLQALNNIFRDRQD